jgi:drug/metabolite transporter (DMT)-like permease
MRHNPPLVRALIAAIAARPRLTALMAAVSISFSGVLYLYSNTSPETASVFRCLYGLPILVAVAYVDRHHTRLRRRTVLLSLFAGVLFAGDLVFWHHAVDYVGAGLATVLGNLQVVIVSFGTWMLFGEKPSNRTLMALPIVLVGVILIAGLISHQAYGTDPVLGVVFGIVAALTYASYLMIMRRVNRTAGTAAPVAISTAATAVVSVVAGAAVGSLDLFPPLESHFWLALLGISAQAVGYLLISYSLPRLPAAVTSIILLAQPVIAVFTAMVLVPEAPSFEQLVGVAFVIGGIALATIPMRARRQRAVETADPSVASSPS